MFIMGVVGWERVTTPFSLVTLLEDLDYIKICLRPHRRSSDTEIRTARALQSYGVLKTEIQSRKSVSSLNWVISLIAPQL